LKGTTLRHFLCSVVLLLPSLLDAQGGYVKFGESDLGGAAWILYIVLAAVILIPGIYLLRSRSAATRPSKASRQKKVKVSDDFKQRAAALGFTVGESRTLERIATRLTPKTPHNLLVTGSGQDYLMADLDKRIAQRQREEATRAHQRQNPEDAGTRCARTRKHSRRDRYGYLGGQERQPGTAGA
jgi:hypothetical protein